MPLREFFVRMTVLHLFIFRFFRSAFFRILGKQKRWFSPSKFLLFDQFCLSLRGSISVKIPGKRDMTRNKSAGERMCPALATATQKSGAFTGKYSSYSLHFTLESMDSIPPQCSSSIDTIHIHMRN